MEKKKIPDRKQGKHARKTTQNPAQRLAKQRMQKDLQKKLLDTHKKAKEQLDTNQEQNQTPEADAVTRLEQIAEQIFTTPSIHYQRAKKARTGAISSIPAQKTNVPHNTKAPYSQDASAVSIRKSEPKVKKVQSQAAANPAMKRWAQQRIIEQKQKMQIDTKVKMQVPFAVHTKPETRAEEVMLPVSSVQTDSITTPSVKVPANQCVPNTNWAHTMIKKKQAEFRWKYGVSKTNPKKEIHGRERIQKNSSPVKWIDHTPIDRDATEMQSISPIQRVSATSSAPPFSSSVSSSDHTSQIKKQPADTIAKKTRHKSPEQHTIQSVQPRKNVACVQQPIRSSGYQTQRQTRFFKTWQKQQRQHIARASFFRPSGSSSRNIWQKAKIIVEKLRLLTTHTSAWVVALVVLLTFLLLFGAVSGLVTSPFGVFFSSQETSPEARSVRAAITETNNEYFNQLDDLIRNTAHDTLVIRQIPSQQANDTQIHNWEEILAVFAVQTTTDSQTAMDVVKLDDKRIDKLKDIFWQMVSIEHKTHTTGSGDNKKTTLTITITTKSAAQMADELHFSKVQKGALDELLANRLWLTELIGQATGSDSEHGGGDYQIPPEALGDEKFKAMITEAEKYLGFPYVWGGSSPSTSFDCSGFVSWVINKSGVGNVGRQTAQGLYNLSTPISKTQAKPGDLVFFTKTYNSPNPVTHIGIFVGDGKMIHCGNPIQYTSIETSYWKKHFYGFGRI